jgi:hypothetical protein
MGEPSGGGSRETECRQAASAGIEDEDGTLFEEISTGLRS